MKVAPVFETAFGNLYGKPCWGVWIDLGGVLKTHPFSRTHEQWLLYEPTGKVLILRADRRYSHHPANRPEGQNAWRPIQS